MEILSLAYYVTGGNKICTWEEQKSISEDTALLIGNTKGTRHAESFAWGDSLSA